MKKYVLRLLVRRRQCDGDGKMKGNARHEGAGLAEMSQADSPVPPGSAISTEVTDLCFDSGNTVPAEVDAQMNEALAALEAKMGQKLGANDNPLLVSVRSGAKFSMPGMMDEFEPGFERPNRGSGERKGGNPRTTPDCCGGFIRCSATWCWTSRKTSTRSSKPAREKVKAKYDTDLTAEDLKAVIADYKKLVEKKTGKPFPQDARQQLAMARDAVFRSWVDDGLSPMLRESVPVISAPASTTQGHAIVQWAETSDTDVRLC